MTHTLVHLDRNHARTIPVCSCGWQSFLIGSNDLAIRAAVREHDEHAGAAS